MTFDNIKKTALQEEIISDIHNIISGNTHNDNNKLKNMKFLSEKQLKEIILTSQSSLLNQICSFFVIDTDTALIIAENLVVVKENADKVLDFLFLIEGRKLKKEQEEIILKCKEKIVKILAENKSKEINDEKICIFKDLSEFFYMDERNIGDLAYELNFVEYGKIGQKIQEIFKHDKEVIVQNEDVEYLNVKVKEEFKGEYQIFLNKVLTIPADDPCWADFYFQVLNKTMKNKYNNEDQKLMIRQLANQMNKGEEVYNYYISRLNGELLESIIFKYFKNNEQDFSVGKLNVFYLLVKMINDKNNDELKTIKDLNAIKLFGNYDIEKYYFNHNGVFDSLWTHKKEYVMLVLNVMSKNEPEKFISMFKSYLDMMLSGRLYIMSKEEISIFDVIKDNFYPNIRAFFYFKEYYYPIALNITKESKKIFILTEMKVFNAVIFNEDLHSYVREIFDEYVEKTGSDFSLSDKENYEKIEQVAKEVAEKDYKLTSSSEIKDEMEDYVFSKLSNFTKMNREGYQFGTLINCIMYLNCPLKELFEKGNVKKEDSDLFLMTLYIAHLASEFMCVKNLLNGQNFDLNLNSDSIVNEVLNAKQWNESAPLRADNPDWKINIKLKDFLELATKLKYLGKFSHKQYIDLILSGLSSSKTTKFDTTDFESFVLENEEFNSVVHWEIFKEYISSN